MKTNTAYIALGTNLGDTFGNLLTACEKTEKYLGEIILKSSVIQTPPWGNIKGQNNFLNAVIGVNTMLPPILLMKKMLEIEQQMGRVRDQKWGPRLIDLDLVYYANDIVKTEHLQVPHPYLQNRRFVLYSLSEIAPDFVHPVLKKTNRQLLAECEDNAEITLYDRAL